MMEIRLYDTFLCELPDDKAIDTAFHLAYVWFTRTGSFADIVCKNKNTKYLPSDEIRKQLQISIENWHTSCK